MSQTAIICVDYRQKIIVISKGHLHFSPFFTSLFFPPSYSFCPNGNVNVCTRQYVSHIFSFFFKIEMFSETLLLQVFEKGHIQKSSYKTILDQTAALGAKQWHSQTCVEPTFNLQ